MTRVLPTVLVVDDDRVNRLMLAEVLKDECRVVLAKDGPSALQRARSEAQLDLVLLDVAMPGMSGYSVLRELQSDERTACIPVVFITGQAEQEHEEQGLLLGAVDYVVKPVRPAIVRARVRNQLRLVTQRRQLERLAAHDSLTGLANRRHFDEAFDMAARLAVRLNEPLSVAMIDVDCFKQYNDRYGHGAGDDALRQVAGVTAGFARRPYDLAARYGGEEFVLMLPGAMELGVVIERLRASVEALQVPHESTSAGVLTISAGGVSAVPNADAPQDLLRLADARLYDAKHHGRNRVVV